MGRPAVDDEVVRRVARRLGAAGVPSPTTDARLLVEHVVEVFGSAAGCGGHLLDGLVDRRAARVPLQQVIGRTWFRTLELVCAPGVFVPRPETEIVAGEAIALAAAAGRAPRVVEPCTGSGAITCALVAEVPGVEVVASDVDPVAVELARTNLARTLAGEADPDAPAPGARGRVVPGDLLDPVDPAWRGLVDVLVANPPYLPAADRASWSPEVRHDPEPALVGGADGHEVVDRLLHLASSWLRPGGSVVIELDDRRGDDAVAVALRAGLVHPRLVRDLTGRDRAVVAESAR
ncbi:MAG: HemK/PrmC family methyltransferase [Nitriliruptor sp.]